MKRFREQHIEEATPAMWAAPSVATRDILSQVATHPTEAPLEASICAVNTLIQSSSDFVKMVLGDKSVASRPLSQEEIRKRRERAKEYIDKMDHYGVLSLTKHDDDLLMWAHYAEEHRGAVFEIDVDDEAFCAGLTQGPFGAEQADEWRGDVQYPKARPAPPVSHAEFIASFFLKSPQWAYEDEYRIIRRLEKGAKPKVTSKNDAEASETKIRHAVYVFTLPMSCIKRLVFGARFDQDALTEIGRSLRNQPKMAHVKLSKAHLKEDEYGLEIRPLVV